MIRSLAIALIALAVLPAAAQDVPFAEEPRVTWERTVGGRGGDRIVALAPAGDGAVAAAGTLFAGGEDVGDAWIGLYDAQGNIQWQHMSGGKGEQSYAAVAVADGRIVAAGQDDAALAPMVQARDGLGRPLWAAGEAPGRDAVILGAAAGPGLILTGAARGSDVARGMALALDPATGEPRWRFDDGAPAGSVFLAAGPASGDVFVTGWAEVAGDVSRKRPVLARLSPGGELLWRRILGADHEEGAFHALSPRPDGGAVLAGTAILGTGHPVPRVMAVNGDGNFLWEYRPADELGSALAAVALSDGGAAAAGYLLSRPGSTRRAWLVRIDAEGNLMWQKVFEHRADAAIHALVLSDGALTAAGSRVGDETGEDGWLFQLR